MIPQSRLRPGVSVALSLGLFVATFLLTRQTQIPALSGLAAPWALLVTITYLRASPALGMIAPIAAYVSLSLLTSLALGVDSGNALRFYVITLGTLLAFYIKPRRISAPLALLPLVLQAIVVAGISLWISQDDELAIAARILAREANLGDIYTVNGIYYRVQLIGNALLPLLFLVSLWKYREGRFYRWATWLSLLGVIAAGNLTYMLVVGLAAFIRLGAKLRKSVGAWLLVGAVLIASVVAGWSDIEEVVERKFEGSDSSMGVRFDQVDVLATAWGDSPATFLVGAGLGAPYPDGKERNYSEYQYIEVQALYMTYQLGVVGILLYLGSLAALVHRFLDPAGRTIFWLYLLSGCTNPTVLDTNQIVTAMLLVCLFPRRTQAEPMHALRPVTSAA